MTKFETIGMSIQYNAYSKEYAVQRFNQSCDICCNRGMFIKCDQCAINAAHRLVVATFDDLEQSNH